MKQQYSPAKKNTNSRFKCERESLWYTPIENHIKTQWKLKRKPNKLKDKKNPT